MSINAINSVSLYEYYYSINEREEKKKKSSPLEDEMRKYNLTPTENESFNIVLLNRAKKLEAIQKQEENTQELPSNRPWADLMYQLNLSFNADPKDDIQDIKDEVAKLVQGFDDEELQKEVLDLEDYAQKLYLNYQQNSSSSVYGYDTLGSQLSNISMFNRANLL